MAAFELALAGETASVLADPVLVFGSLAATGILGVTDIFGGDADEDEPDESAGDGGMFDESEFDDGGGGDEFAFDDGGGGGGEFDDFDMDGDGEDGAGGGAGVTQLENRVDEIEEELSSLSSTVSTVRTENEQIGESVEDIEENVRKLLDIYKMVTKGVNPFVDQKGGGEAMASPGGGSLGLFDDEEEEAGPAEGSNLDEDVVEAEAEEFFDDDFDEGEEEFDEGETDDAVDGEGADDEDDAESSGGGRSFDELREEYEEGGGWEDEEGADDEDGAEEAEEAEDEADDAEENAETEDDPDERLDELVEETTEEPAPETERRTRTVREEVEQSSPTPDREETAAAAAESEREKPYLHGIPAGYSNDLLAIEWVEFLVAEGNTAAARHAISYYERVEWIDAAAGDRLREFLDGQPATASGEGRDAGALTMDHHAKSLEYIARINGDSFSPVSVSRGPERESVRERSRTGTITGSAASR